MALQMDGGIGRLKISQSLARYQVFKKKKKKRSHLGRDPWYYGELRSTGISDTSIAVSAAFKTVMSWLRLQLHIPFFKL